MQRIFLFIFLFFSLVACSTINDEDIIFEVNNGDSIARISSRLIHDKIINNKFYFRVIAKLTGQENKIKIGIYRIPHHINYFQLLDIISSGISISTPITIPEGFNSFQIAALLEQYDIVSAKDFLTEIAQNYRLEQFHLKTNHLPIIIQDIKYFSDYNNSDFAVPNPIYHSIEGYLFPDTYSFHKNMSASNIVNIFVKRFLQVVNPQILNQIASQHKTLNEVITFASIIQKEAVNNSEMAKVAGVYNNRLNRKMILQADPTLIYALILDGEYHGNIKTRHLRPPWPSPYNTYYITTLPPGPIANPGKDAILATLYPENHHYLYFVGNPNRTHTYSYTLAEHNKAVQTWIKYRRGQK